MRVIGLEPVSYTQLDVYKRQPITNNEARQMEREPIEDASKLIIADVEYAAANLEPFYDEEELGRVGAVAAKCLLGQVYGPTDMTSDIVQFYTIEIHQYKMPYTGFRQLDGNRCATAA